MTNLALIHPTTTPTLVENKTKHKTDAEGVAEFGARFSRLLREAGYTESEFSRIMGVSRSAVNLWATGKSYCSYDHSKTIASILNVTPWYLMYGPAAGMIAVADISDKEITEEPRTMLITVSGKNTQPYRVSKDKRKRITVEDMTNRPVMVGTEAEFKMNHAVIGRLVTSLQSSGA